MEEELTVGVELNNPSTSSKKKIQDIAVDGILPLTEETLKDFAKSSAWMKNNIFTNASAQKIGIGVVGTGGGANLFDYLFRSGSSAAMVFADFEYHQNASYDYCKEFLDTDNGVAIDETQSKQLGDLSLKVMPEIHERTGFKSASFVSTPITNALALSGLNKLKKINDDRQRTTNTKFETIVAISWSADYGQDFPPRFCISLVDSNNYTNTYAFAYKDEKNDGAWVPSREVVSNRIVIEILHVLYHYINRNQQQYGMRCTQDDRFSFSKVGDDERSVEPHIHNLLLLETEKDKIKIADITKIIQQQQESSGGQKKKSTRRKRNKFNSKSRRAF